MAFSVAVVGAMTILVAIGVTGGEGSGGFVGLSLPHVIIAKNATKIRTVTIPRDTTLIVYASIECVSIVMLASC